MPQIELPFRDRPLNPLEVERLRLTLSTFRDGSGQVVLKPAAETMPGWRDYERSLAAVIGGRTPEDKGVLDVVVETESDPFGISCKMAVEQPITSKCILMELSNSAAKFRAHLLARSINWATEPTLAGPEIIELVTSWHYDLAGDMDISSSFYAVLAHDTRWRRFRIFAFPLDLKLADPKKDVTWLKEGASLNGYVDDGGRRHRLWQCFMNSGGQLKYYPLVDWALWSTEPFALEEPPRASPFDKVERYFPELWAKANLSDPGIGKRGSA